MSTNPIIIEIVDRIDSSIAGKIKAIGLAARQASNDLNNLQMAITNVSGGTTRLSAALTQINAPLKDVAESTSQLERGIGNLLGRILGMELGLGRLGGAFAGIGIAAAGAVSLIAIALVAIAGVGLVIINSKIEAAAEELTKAQADVAEKTQELNTALLDQKEHLVGLTAGPLAKYRQQLLDLPFKAMKIDLADLEKEWKAQDSFWSDGLLKIQAFTAGIIDFLDKATKMSTITSFQPLQTNAFSIGDAMAFVNGQEKIRKEGSQTKDILAADAKAIADDAKKNTDEVTKNNLNALLNEMVNYRSVLEQKKALLATQEGARAALTQQGIDVVQQSYDRDLLRYTKYLNDKTVAGAEYNKQALADAVKEATERARAQMKAFDDEMKAFKASGGVKTPQDELGLLQAQQTGAQRSTLIGPSQSVLPENEQKMIDKANELTIEINKQGAVIDGIIGKYQATVMATGAFTEAQKAAAEATKMLAQLERDRIPIGDAALQQRIKDIAAAGEKTREDNKAAQILRDYNIGLTDQIALSGKYGQALIVETQIMSLRKTLQKDNRDLDEQQQAQLRQTLTSLEQQKIVQRDLTALWDANAGAIQKSAAQITAVNKAYADGVITLDQWKIAALNAALAQNQLNNTVSGGTLQSNIKQVWGGLITDFNSLQNLGHQVTQNLDKDFTQFFSTLEKGIGNGIAQWAVYGKSLSQALLDTARQAVAGLISSLIDLALQYVIVIALQKAFNIQLPTKENDTTKVTLLNTAVALASIAAVTVAELTAINVLSGPAWALAEAVSILSFGAADAAAVAGMAAVVSAGSAASVPKLAAGGLVMGPGGVDKVPAWLTRGEFVVNAAATEQNRSLLESINSGATATRTNSAPVSVGGTQMQISIVHDGATSIGVQQIDEKTVRIIAKQEARAGVSLYAPGVISSDLQNPNSKTSKAINVNLVSPRRR